MNHSGRAVGAIAQYYKIPPEEILIAHDELDLPIGTVRRVKIRRWGRWTQWFT